MEESAAEEVMAAWRSRPRRVAVGGGVEEPATPRHGGAQGGAGCREGGGMEDRSRWAAVGPGPLVGGLHRADAGVSVG
jgi:hypothetical protein